MPDDKQWGGAGRGQGRKPLDETDPTVIVPIRMTISQKKKYLALGGPAWVRERIDKAKLKPRDDGSSDEA